MTARANSKESLVESLEQQISTLKAELSVAEEYKEQLHKDKKQNRNQSILKEAVSKLKAQKEAKGADLLRQERERMQQNLLDCTTQNKLLEQTIEQLRKDVEERSLQQKRHEHELEQLSTVATRYNNLRVLILGKADTLDTSTQDQEQLEIALEKEVKRLRDVSEKNSTLSTDIKTVTREKQEVEERLTELNKALKKHELEILQLKNSEKQLQQSTEALHLDIKKKSSEVDKLTVEVSNLTKTNQELSEQNIQSKQVVTEQSKELALL